jgi:hypothetical protein
VRAYIDSILAGGRRKARLGAVAPRWFGEGVGISGDSTMHRRDCGLRQGRGNAGEGETPEIAEGELGSRA